MSDKKLDILEKEIDDLLSLTNKLKEINIDLIEKKQKLEKEVRNLNKTLDSIEGKIEKLIGNN